MPAGRMGGGGGSRAKEPRTKAMDKNAQRKLEAEATKEPSAHAAKVKAKKDLAKEKVKARKEVVTGGRKAEREREKKEGRREKRIGSLCCRRIAREA